MRRERRTGRTMPGMLLCLLVLVGAVDARAAPPTLAEWDRAFSRALKLQAEKLIRLAKRCERGKLHATAWLRRQEALRWTPDDEKLRTKLGYARVDEGWERKPPVRDGLRALDDDPGARAARDAERRFVLFRAGAARRIRDLARKAIAANEAAADPAWAPRIEGAWRQVLVAEPGHEDAHEALGSKRVDGTLVLPRWQPYLRARRERFEAGRKRAALPFETTTIPLDGPASAASLQGGAARSGFSVVTSEFGLVAAKACAVWSRRAVVDLEAEYGYGESILSTLGSYRFYSMCGKDSACRLMTRGFHWTAEKANAELTRAGGVYPDWLTFVSYTDSVDAAADGYVQVICKTLTMRRRQIARLRDPEPAPVEAWFLEAVALDVVVRLTGRALTSFQAKTRYTGEEREIPPLNRWGAIAMFRVLRDDDIPMSKLHKLRFNQLEQDEMAKAVMFLRFLFEKDADDARTFVRELLDTDTPAAVKKAYGKSPDEMDREYAEWVRWTL